MEKRIYLVEDNIPTQKLVERFLKKEGYDLIGKSTNAEIAFHEIQILKPDLIISDINLEGEMNGIDLASKLSKMYSCPIVFITGDESKETIEKSFEVRPFGYLYKPLKIEALLSTVKQAIEKFYTDEKLKETETNFQLLIDNLKDYAIFLTDLDGKITTWNRGCEMFLEVNSENAIGKSFIEIFRSEDHSVLSSRAFALKMGSYSTEFELDKDSNKKNIYFTLTPIKDKFLNLKGFSIILRDITNAKKVEKIEQELKSYLERENLELEVKVAKRTEELEKAFLSQQKLIELNKNFQQVLLKTQKNLYEAQKLSHLGDWEYDIESGELIFSPEIYNLLSIHPKDGPLKPDKFFKIITPVENQDYSEILKRIYRKEKEINYDIITNINSVEKAFNIKIIFIIGIDGNLKSIFGTMHDITDSKRAEKEIKLALEKQKEVNQLKDKFVSLISHEFRTPLTIIGTSVQLIERAIGEGSPQDNKSKFSKVYNSLKRLNQLLDDILDIARIQEGKVLTRFEKVNIVNECKQIIEEVTVESSSSNRIEIITQESEILISIDKKLFHHVLINLLSNALKYSPSETKVTLSIEKTDSNAILTVSDQGIGIPEEDLPNIFESFYRCSNSGFVKGTGLGLSIVKEYVEVLNGSIQVKSELNQGSSFIVSIPLGL
ncbi:MAG: ATP-binding protein [Leptospiraceae bacterium]|nr:ATP-binding protein [Leptospiraceae bacterium]